MMSEARGPRIEIEYCTGCRWLLRAAWTAQELLTTFEQELGEVTLVPEAPFPNRAYWLQVPPSDGAVAARINAKIDRDTNTITIDADGVTEVSLYFNDDLIDLEKPVKVICNGAENIDQIPRSFKVTMEMIFKARSDPGRVYVASKSYSVPAKVPK